jgi:maltodextrin utilization protein YvdJ
LKENGRRRWYESDTAHVAVSLMLMFSLALISVAFLAALIKLLFWVIFRL